MKSVFLLLFSCYFPFSLLYHFDELFYGASCFLKIAYRGKVNTLLEGFSIFRIVKDHELQACFFDGKPFYIDLENMLILWVN